jgi:hypothetical protein
MVGWNAETPLVGVVSGHDAGAGGLIPRPRSSEVCGLMIERLQDMSVYLRCIHCLAIR